MGSAPWFGRSAPAGFGMGSVGRGGSVSAGETRRVIANRAYPTVVHTTRNNPGDDVSNDVLGRIEYDELV